MKWTSPGFSSSDSSAIHASRQISSYLDSLTSWVESPSWVKILAFFRWTDSVARSIQSGFRGEQGRGKRIALAGDGSAACPATRRANARVLLDDGWSCREVAAALLFDDDTIRGWRNLFEPRGTEGLISFDVGGGAGFPSAAQDDVLKAWLAAKPPRSTRQIGAFIEQEFCGVYESRSGLIALLHRLSLEYHKPEIIPRKLAEAKHPTRARRLLGATAREARDPANERASAHQQSPRLRSRNRPALRDRLPRSLRPDDRGPGH